MEQCDSGLILARMTALMSSRAINLNEVLKYELAAVPTSIFDEKSGELRISKSKSILKRRLGTPMAQQRIHQGCRVELHQVCHQQDALLQTNTCNI